MPYGNVSFVIRLSPLQPGYVMTVCAAVNVETATVRIIDENMLMVGSGVVVTGDNSKYYDWHAPSSARIELRYADRFTLVFLGVLFRCTAHVTRQKARRNVVRTSISLPSSESLLGSGSGVVAQLSRPYKMPLFTVYGMTMGLSIQCLAICIAHSLASRDINGLESETILWNNYSFIR